MLYMAPSHFFLFKALNKVNLVREMPFYDYVKDFVRFSLQGFFVGRNK